MSLFVVLIICALQSVVLLIEASHLQIDLNQLLCYKALDKVT